jgi:hypothetical protein
MHCSLFRLRQELTKLILKHTEGISDSVAKATTQSTLYEGLLQGLSVSLTLPPFELLCLTTTLFRREHTQ